MRHLLFAILLLLHLPVGAQPTCAAVVQGSSARVEIIKQLAEMQVAMVHSPLLTKSALSQAFDKKFSEALTALQMSADQLLAKIRAQARKLDEATDSKQAAEQESETRRQNRIRLPLENSQSIQSEIKDITASYFDAQDNALYILGAKQGSGAFGVIDLKNETTKLLAHDEYYVFGGAKYTLSNGKEFWASAPNNEMLLLDPGTGKIPLDSLEAAGSVSRQVPTLYATSGEWSASGETVDVRKSISVTNLKTGKSYNILYLQNRTVPDQIAITPDQKHLAVMESNKMHLFDLISGQILITVEVSPEERRFWLNFDQQGRAHFTSVKAQTHVVFRTDTWQEISKVKLDTLEDSELPIQLSADGASIYVATQNGFKIFSSHTGQTIEEHQIGDRPKSFKLYSDSLTVGIFSRTTIYLFTPHQ